MSRDFYRNRSALGSIPQLESKVMAEYIPTANTKLLLHFNGNANDSSGNGSNGSASGVTYPDAPTATFNKVVNFPGSGRISFSKNSYTYLLNNWTMVAWVKRNVTGTENGIIYQMGNCFFRPTGANYWDGSGDRRVSNGSFDQSDITKYHLYVWTKSSTGGQKFYQDGELVATQASTSNNSNDYSNVFFGYQSSPASNQSANQRADEFILESGIWDDTKVLNYFNDNKKGFGIS